MARDITLISRTLTSAETYIGDVAVVPFGTRTLSAQMAFVRAAGGTTCDVFLQTSLDGGSTWIDIMQWAPTTTTLTRISVIKLDIAFTANYTPLDGSLGDNSIKDGLLGDIVRAKIITTGTYTGASSVALTVVAL